MLLSENWSHNKDVGSLGFIMKSQFHCTHCGECCRHIGNIPALREYDNGNGVCIFLNQDTNLCTIYPKRPLICNVDQVYEEYFSRYYSEEEYLELNYKVCEALRNKEINK